MLKVIDRLAGKWFDWRTDRAVARCPELQDLKLHKAEFKSGSAWDMELSGSAVAVIADQTADILKNLGADNYVQFDMLPRLDRGIRPIRVTVQWAHGISPAMKAAQLAEEVQRLITVLEQVAGWDDAGESELPEDLYRAVMAALGRPAV